MRVLGVVLVAWVLSACAGKTADPGLDAEAKLFRAQTDKACMYVLPSSRVSTVTIFMDERKVGTLEAGDYFRLDVAPGTHVLYVARPSPLPTFTREKRDDLKIEVEAGRCYFLRTAWRGVDEVLHEFRLYLESMPDDEGRRAVNVRWLVPAAK
ncbi:MAG: hypothetical protein H6Q86_986 [candidate division NC10 bacterium]|nr:hypothetical protein [candidate division NC10 bacterium]